MNVCGHLEDQECAGRKFFSVEQTVFCTSTKIGSISSYHGVSGIHQLKSIIPLQIYYSRCVPGSSKTNTYSIVPVKNLFIQDFFPGLITQRTCLLHRVGADHTVTTQRSSLPPGLHEVVPSVTVSHEEGNMPRCSSHQFSVSEGPWLIPIIHHSLHRTYAHTTHYTAILSTYLCC